MRLTILASVGALIALAASPLPAFSAPPNIKDQKAVEAWMAEAKIDQGGISRFDKTWLLIGVGPEGVYLSRRTIETTIQKNLMLVVNRLELFEPIVDGARSIQSISFDHEIDCRKKVSRRVLLTTYTKRNLTGDPVSEKIVEEFAPMTRDPMMKSVADDLCRAADEPMPGNSRGMIGGVHGQVIIPGGR